MYWLFTSVANLKLEFNRWIYKNIGFNHSWNLLFISIFIHSHKFVYEWIDAKEFGLYLKNELLGNVDTHKLFWF